MTQDQFYNWLENPSTMDSSSIVQLREVIKRYPYFQAAQMMLAKNLKSENHIDQLKQLQIAALLVPDRRLFQNYLYNKKRTQPKVVETEEKKTLVETRQAAIEKKEPVAEDVSEKPLEEIEEVKHDSLYDLIPEPVVYQLETADLPELPTEKIEQREETTEPEALSFTEWLDFTHSGKADSIPAATNKAKTEKSKPSRSNFELIDHFLSQQSDKPKKRAEFFNPQKAGAKSLQEDFTVVSETLANIYFQQEKYELAQQSYQALSLKYPEKSAYFAARLKEINDKLNSD